MLTKPPQGQFSTLGRKMKARAQRGFGLLEIAIGLVIAAALAAAVMTFFQNANNNSKTNESLGQIAAIQGAVQALYNGQPTYDGLDTASIADSGALPAKMIVGSTMRNPFNGEAIVASATPFDTYTVELGNIPSDPCLKLVSQDLGQNVHLMEVFSANAGPATGTPTGSVNRRAMNIGEAETACNGANRVDIRWEFY